MSLAATWAAERFQQFLLGLNFILETDHKPLLSLLGKMNIEELPPRIQRFRIRLMRFNYNIVYVPGDKTATADTLSRSPEENSEGSDFLTETDVEAYVSYIIKTIPSSVNRLNQIKEELLKDIPCKFVMEFCKTGWPEYKDLPHEAGPYWKYKDDLTVSDGFLLKGPRLVIPKSLQREILSRIHDGHLGINKCRERAKESVWWPGLSLQIKEMVTCCPNCIKTRNYKCEPLIPSTPPSRPWERVATDLFEFKGKKYLLVTDYYSRYPEVGPLESFTSPAIIEHLKEIFSRHGIPDVVVSDNGPQYASAEFKKFAIDYGFLHITSSPRYPQANGEAERMVQTVKNLMERAQDLHLALLTYRNTPGPTGSSPAQLSMGRRLKTRLPVHPSQLKPKWPNLNMHIVKDKKGKEEQKRAFDQRHSSTPLKPLNVGDKVWIRDMKTPAVIKAKADTPRSYIAETPRKERIRRNRRHLIPMPEDQENTSMPDMEDSFLPENPYERSPSPYQKGTPQLEQSRTSPSRSPTSQLNVSSPKPVPDSPRYTRSGRLVKKPDRLDI